MDYETLTQQSRHNAAIEAEEINLVALLRPRVFIDGNKWCVLYGEDLMNGVAGFGDSPMLAVYDFNKAWRKEIKHDSKRTQQPAACPKCDGTGEADSGGIHPWGAPATIPCDCQQPAAVDELAELVGLLDEVRSHFTRDDDLPDDLLPRIDAALRWIAGGSDNDR